MSQTESYYTTRLQLQAFSLTPLDCILERAMMANSRLKMG